MHKENYFLCFKWSYLLLRLAAMYPISNCSLVCIYLLTFYWLLSIHYEKKQFEMSLLPLSNPCAFMNSRKATLSKLPNLLNAVTWQRMLISFWRKIILCYVRTKNKSTILWSARLFLRRGVQLLSVHSTSQSSTWLHLPSPWWCHISRHSTAAAILLADRWAAHYVND